MVFVLGRQAMMCAPIRCPERDQRRQIDEIPTSTVDFDESVDRSVHRGISELLSENAQLQPLSGDLSSHTAVFGSQQLSGDPQTGVSPHKMVVI
jgi:hypothetical protein